MTFWLDLNLCLPHRRKDAGSCCGAIDNSLLRCSVLGWNPRKTGCMHAQVFEEMQQEGVEPTAVTYGCLLVACEQLGDVERAFQLYKQACERGIVPTDECHNILINVCAATGRSAFACFAAPWHISTNQPGNCRKFCYISA